MWALLRRDAMSVWEQFELKDRLVEYREIFQGRRIPRYKLARLFYVPIDGKKSQKDLLDIHEHHQVKFKKWLEEKQNLPLEEVEKEVFAQYKEEVIRENNYLKLKVSITQDILSACEFCENKCRADRASGKVGNCGVDGQAYISSAFVHMGEESPIVPSGTIFFYGCTFQCVFCQNHDISQEFSFERFRGKGHTPSDLAKMYYSLKGQGVRNINFVGGEPTPNLHLILESFLEAQVNLPMLWNSNMYLTETSMKLLVDIFDIWLPDYKYSNNECATKYSNAPKYKEALERNMKMIEERGSGEYIIRHLVMPNHTECCSIPILNWVNENLKTPLVNIMAQYRPEYKVLRTEMYPEIKKRPSTSEMYNVRKHADDLGIYWKSVS